MPTLAPPLTLGSRQACDPSTPNLAPYPGEPDDDCQAPSFSPRAPSLVQHESNAHRPLTWYQRLRHKDSLETRPLVRAALERIQTSPKTLEIFDNCGNTAWLYRHRTTGALRVTADSCRNRHCQACTRKRSARIAANLLPLCQAAGRNLSMITLTLRHRHSPLRTQIHRLTKCFRETRRLEFWRSLVKAAAWTLEVKIGNDGHWHPHIHCLAHAAYIPHPQLCAAWFAITGDSDIVDVRRVSARAGCSHICKYITKPVDDQVIFGGRLDEYMLAIKGVHVCAALGKWRGTRLSHPTEKLEAADWESLGALDTIQAHARSGDAASQALLHTLEVACQRFPSPRSTGPPGSESTALWSSHGSSATTSP